jgi:hypothetical protein
MFHLEVRDKSSGELVQNLTSATPRFLVTDLPPANWLSGLNLTVYTASREGTINTVETLGVFTSKVAELQIESIEETNVPLGGLGIAIGIVLTLILLFLLLVIKVFTRNNSPHQDLSNSEIYEKTKERSNYSETPDPAFTVYDKVDLLSPVQNNLFLQEFADTSDSSDLLQASCSSVIVLPQRHQTPSSFLSFKSGKSIETIITDKGCNIAEKTLECQKSEYKRDKKHSGDSLSCLLSDIHQESIL